MESSPNSPCLVFVGGPFHHAVSDSGIFDPLVGSLIIEVITSLKEAGFTILSSHLAEQFGQISPDGGADEIVRRDFGWMQRCAVYVCLLPNDEDGKSYRSDGSCIELGWASALKKPTILVRDMNTSFTDLVLGLGALGSIEHLSILDVANNPNVLIEALQLLLREYSMERSAV